MPTNPRGKQSTFFKYWRKIRLRLNYLRCGVWGWRVAEARAGGIGKMIVKLDPQERIEADAQSTPIQGCRDDMGVDMSGAPSRRQQWRRLAIAGLALVLLGVAAGVIEGGARYRERHGTDVPSN